MLPYDSVSGSEMWAEMSYVILPPLLSRMPMPRETLMLHTEERGHNRLGMRVIVLSRTPTLTADQPLQEQETNS